ncbi:uncharacterized protein LOC131224802 [Magnolia sinica]|uniref:uncharacterized protein LOC131224802 n=1 Tax=Magnolia sinica TaxID=86752 RepID=UPI00265894F0|nr:uncharacterized protein LOC131224802 [Magnolia sinica]
MGRGGKFDFRKGNRKRKRKPIQSKDEGSDDSDEDYVVEEDESEDENSEESRALSSGNFSEESFDFSATSCSGGSDEDRRAVRPKSRKGSGGGRKSGANRRKSRVSSTTSEDLSDESFDVVATSCSGSSDEDLKVVRPNPRKGFPGRRKSGVRERKVRVYRISDDGTDDDEDEEFMPDMDDFVDDEEEYQVGKKNRVRNQVSQRKRPSESRRAQRKSKKQKEKKKTATKRQGRLVLRRTVSSDDDFVMEDRIVEEKSRKKGRRRKRRAIVHSDSDFMDSESSDFDYTISEEERELIREAGNNGNLTTGLRSSSLSERVQVNGASTRQQVKILERKGKEKANDLQLDVGKQVCGICLSEEREGIVRGTLNSCFHYFCFTCIMEWSKVESRCPVCKRRFKTISKPARSDIGIGLRNAVIRVPRRDQVYRPSEEEMRGYLDPYENVVCIECQQGGDDNLMLLCDICDSSAHTYCVGLGREVPEGNWYCEGCKSSDLRTANSQVQDSVPDQGTSNSALRTEHAASRIDAEGFDMHTHSCTASQHSVSIPQQLSSLGIDMLPSPRYTVGEDRQAASPMSGGAASTVLERRRLRLRIHHLISNSRMTQICEMFDRSDGLLHTSHESDVHIPEDEHARRLESGVSHYAAVEGRAQVIDRSSTFQGGSRTCSAQNGDAFHPRLSYARNQVTQGLSATPSIDLANESLHAEHGGINPSHTVLGDEQWSRPVIGSTANISRYMHSEGGSSHAAEDAKDHVRTIVKSHLKLLCKDLGLGRDAFAEIARRSTHTILAACGIRHSRSATIPIEQPSDCTHVEKEGEQTTLMKGYCASCFNSFVGDVVLTITKMKLPQ